MERSSGLSGGLPQSSQSPKSVRSARSASEASEGTILEERHAIGALEASAALFKAIVGPGTLFLPAGVRNAGLLSSLTITLMTGVLATWCMSLVLEATRALRKRGVMVLDFGDLGQAAFGKYGKWAVEVAVGASQMGFCTAYCVFVAENLQAVLFEAYGGTVGDAAPEDKSCSLPPLFAGKMLVYRIIAMVIPLLIPVTWVRQLRYFSASNMIANLLVLTSLLYVFVAFGFRFGAGEAADVTTLRWFRPAETLVYFGTASYAFEGIGVLLTVERSMSKPDHMKPVIYATMVVAVSLQMIFSASAYVLYGDKTASVITVSLSRASFLGGTVAVQAVQLAWVIEVLLTFPLQLFPVARIIERKLFPERRSGRRWIKNTIRSCLVFLSMGIALFGFTSVDNLVALIGALGCVPLALVFPALFHWRIVCMGAGGGDEDNGTEALLANQDHSQVDSIDDLKAALQAGKRRRCLAISDLAIASLGFCGVVLATVLAIHSWATSSFHYQVCVPDSP